MGSMSFGCHAYELAKLFPEMAMAVESTHQNNLHVGMIAAFQQLLYPFNALLEQLSTKNSTKHCTLGSK